MEVNDKERAIGPRVRLCNSHKYTAELSSPSKQQHAHTTLCSRGCMFDQGYDSSHKMSDPLTTNVSVWLFNSSYSFHGPYRGEISC